MPPHFSDSDEPPEDIQETLREMDPYDADTGSEKIMQSRVENLIKKAQTAIEKQLDKSDNINIKELTKKKKLK